MAEFTGDRSLAGQTQLAHSAKNRVWSHSYTKAVQISGILARPMRLQRRVRLRNLGVKLCNYRVSLLESAKQRRPAKKQVVESTEMESCEICHQSVISKNRRRLHSPQSENILTGINELRSQKGMPPITADASGNHCYVCKRCFAIVDKFVRLSREVSEIEADLCLKMGREEESAVGESSHVAAGHKRQVSKFCTLVCLMCSCLVNYYTLT